jgi:hypothetical protein
MRNPKGGSPLDFAVLLVENIDQSRDSFYLSSTPAPDLLLNALGLKQNALRVNKSYAFYGARVASSILSANYRNDTLIRVTRNVNPVRGLTTDGINSRWGTALRSKADPACWKGSDFEICAY